MDDPREEPEAVSALVHFTQRELATASDHTRRWHEFIYLEERLWNDERGTNIAARDLSAEQVGANFAQAEHFFARHGILKSALVLPHFYEFGTNVFEWLDRWGAQFVGMVLEPGRDYGTPLLPAKPYLAQEPLRPGAARAARALLGRYEQLRARARKLYPLRHPAGN
jgi:hypothetical protein